jgi:branched-chain amino acid transport system permease protein
VDKFLTFTVVGLSTAAIYAVIASGLVLTYTTTGVFNFAHGAIGMLGAFAYWQLRVGWHWSTPAALAVVLLVLAPLFGVFLEAVVMRGLQGTNEVTKIVVSIGLLAAMIGLATWIWSPNTNRTLAPFYDSKKPFEVFSTSVTYHQAITMGVAIVVAIALRLLLYRTRIGIAMRASVDDASLATLNGARPAMIAMLAWATGCILAAIGGILIAPGAGLDAGLLSLLIVNAYAAAIIGRLRSLPLTFLGALVLGLTDAYLAGYLPAKSQYLQGLRLASPAIVLFIVLLLIPNPRLRGHARTREYFPRPSWSGALALAGLTVLGAAVLATTLSASDATIYVRIFPFAIFALSLVPLTGFAGQISLCQLSFAAIGASVWAQWGTHGNPVYMLIGALAAAVIGALVALPALRLSGIYLALATAAFAVTLDRWIWTLPPIKVFGLFTLNLFQTGSASAVSLKLFGYDFNTAPRQMMLFSVVLALLTLLVVWIRRSAFGRRLLAMRDSEAACATLGMRLLAAKTAVFAISAGMAGLGGALYASQLQSIQVGNFDFISGLPVLLAAVIGGMAYAGTGGFAGITLEAGLPLISKIGPFFANLAGLLPGLAGIGLGRNPNGAISDLRDAFGGAWRDKRIFAAIIGGEIVIWLLRVTDVYKNWTYVILAGVWGLAWLLSVAAVDRFAQQRAARPPDAHTVALEWVGVTEPWHEDDRDELERRLAMSGAELHGVS